MKIDEEKLKKYFARYYNLKYDDIKDKLIIQYNLNKKRYDEADFIIKYNGYDYYFIIDNGQVIIFECKKHENIYNNIVIK